MERRQSGSKSNDSIGESTKHLFRKDSTSPRREAKKNFWTLANILALTYVVTSIAFPILLFALITKETRGVYELCNSDGEFDFDALDNHPVHDYSPNGVGYHYRRFIDLFSRTSIVAVTLPFGRLSFEQAKWIDLAWDIGVARGFQIVLWFVSYVVITRSMLWTMETTSVPHDVFARIFFRGPTSFMALWTVVTVTPKSQLWQAWKGHLLIIMFIMTYLITFPTIMSAMTGYITKYSNWVQIDDNLVDLFSIDFRQVLYTIGNCTVFNQSDGCNIMLFKNLQAGIIETGNTLSLPTYRSIEAAYDCTLHPLPYPDCGVLKTGEKKVHIDPIDSLDITKPDNLYYYQGGFYDAQYIRENGKCQPENLYHWGFSYQLLFIFSILNLLWAVSLWTLWLKAGGDSSIRNIYGEYRAAVDLAAVARESLGSEVEEMTNAEIKSELKRRKIGIVRSDDGTRQLIRWDWAFVYKRTDTEPFMARMAKVGKGIRFGMAYLISVPTKVLLWLRAVWMPRRGRSTERSETFVGALENRGRRLSKQPRP